MNLTRSLKTDVIFYLAGTGFYALSQWLMVIVYARINGPEGVGLFAIATAISAPIVVLSQMSMRQVLIADVVQRFHFSDYLVARWLFSAVAIVAIVCFAAIIGYRGVALLTITAFGIGRAFESVSDIFYARSQAHDGLRRVSSYTGIRGAITLAASGGAMLITHSMLISALAFALASLFCQLAVRSIEGKLIVEKAIGIARRKLSRELLLHSLPLAVSQFLISLTAYAPRLILQHFGGEQLAGQAGVVEYFLSLGLLGVAALGQASSSPMAKAYHRGDRRSFSKIVTILVAGATLLGSGLALAAYLAGEKVIMLLYGPSFAQAGTAAFIIIAGGVFGYVASILGYAVSATGHYKRMIGWSMAVLTVTIAGGYLAIANYNLAGLGYVLAASGIVNILGYVHLLRRAYALIPDVTSMDHSERNHAHG